MFLFVSGASVTDAPVSAKPTGVSGSFERLLGVLCSGKMLHRALRVSVCEARHFFFFFYPRPSFYREGKRPLK